MSYKVQLILPGLEFLWGCGSRGCSMLRRTKKILPLEPGDVARWLRSLAALLPGFSSQHPSRLSVPLVLGHLESFPELLR